MHISILVCVLSKQIQKLEFGKKITHAPTCLLDKLSIENALDALQNSCSKSNKLHPVPLALIQWLVMFAH